MAEALPSPVPEPTGSLDLHGTPCAITMADAGLHLVSRPSFKELRRMNDSRHKLDKAFGWAAFLASYLLVAVLISLPFSDRGTNEQPRTSKGEIASLMAD